jgi:O-succinylbenzoic acid--CoA ligase
MMDNSKNNFLSFSNRKDLTAIIKSDTLISYDELFDKAQQIASTLTVKGIEKNTYIPLQIEDSLSFIETTIALWLLGSIPVPLNTKLLDEEIFSIINDYDFKVLITDKNISNSIMLKITKVISVDELILGSNKSKIHNLPSLNDEAVVIFTSGSTNSPKGVVHTFASLLNNIENGNEILNQNENDRWLASLPFYHIGGFQIICRSLYYGCSIIIPESLQANHLADEIVNNNPTHLSLVSIQLERLIYQKIIPNGSLKVSLIGGGFVEDDLIIDADKLGWKPYRVYGSSETGSMITGISASEIKSKPQSVGKCFSNVEINISDDSEILIKSNSLFKKYLDDEIETSSRLIHGFNHTGDLGFVDDEGYLFIEARRNDLIVSGGENVNPIEVEKVLIELPFIKDACVFPKQNKTWGQIVAATIVIIDSSIAEKNIKEILKQKLAGYKIPKEFYFANELPRTPLGKLEREKIKKMF